MRIAKLGITALALVLALTACKKEAETAAPGTSKAPAVNYFGPDRYGKLTLGMTEPAALATGDLQTAPVATVLGKNVYSYPDGPKPDPKRMAADEKIEKDVAKADSGGFGDSAEGSAKAAKAYADSTQRLTDRLIAYLTNGGATFQDGKLTSIAAPAGAVTDAGVKRGSTEAEVLTAYQSKGLKSEGKSAFSVPVAGQDGWTLLLEMDAGKVAYMSLGRAE
ncbi:hypothetical protein [Actinoplanes sp. L3-i22]|uniref:hypothetical protein n=1 Tax=Actinoplanes sp. L3-i22 TaxID=2836373 RepID=UPI001C762A0C|nr:hypothetical protein [Actinoplanes sp. L3-i22]BCY12218.1 hypothetical protein L3i22_073060 [Actinoplanes sp. L3-i22]